MVQLRVELSLADAPKEPDGPLGRLPDLVPATRLQGEESEDRVPGRRLGVHGVIIPLPEVLSTVLARWSPPGDRPRVPAVIVQRRIAALMSATGVESPPGSLSVEIWRRLTVLSRSDFSIAPARGAQACGMNMG